MRRSKHTGVMVVAIVAFVLVAGWSLWEVGNYQNLPVMYVFEAYGSKQCKAIEVFEPEHRFIDCSLRRFYAEYTVVQVSKHWEPE